MTDTCRTEFKTAKLFDSTLPHGGCAAHELSAYTGTVKSLSRLHRSEHNMSKSTLWDVRNSTYKYFSKSNWNGCNKYFDYRAWKYVNEETFYLKGLSPNVG